MKYLMTLLFLLCFSIFATSQVITSEEMDDLLNSSEIQVDNPVISNFLHIRQIDQANTFTAIQNQQGSMQNNILANQNGTGNSGYIEQTGSGSETYLWQYKSSNEANLWSEGDNIKIEVKQDGTSNTINSFVQNYYLESRAALLTQNGNNNRIDLAVFGNEIPSSSDAQTISITQTGNNNGVEAFLENTFSPIQITQTPGVNGEGMQINISNSAFSFPMKN